MHRLRIGAFELRKIGARGVDARDPYHLALTVGWPAFIAVLLFVYAAITAVFAVIYMLLPGPISERDLSSLPNALFLSFEILSTSGYVAISQNAMAAKLVATVEIVMGLGFIAIMMGLIFVRFSRAKASLVFADKAVVAIHNGKPTLMLRVGNGRIHAMTDTTASLHALVREKTLEGADFYNIYDLPLTRPRTPYFPLTMTLMHTVDAKSVLGGLTSELMAERSIMLFLSFEVRDPALSATMNTLRTFGPADIAFGARYVDAISTNDEGMPVADLGKISLIEPDPFWK